MKKHIERFIKLHSAPDMLALKLFPNAKEITESMGAFEAVQEYILKNDFAQYKDPNTVLLCIGDGVVPRTASLFAFRSNWNCISVDPLMRIEKDWSSVKGLTVIKAKLEDRIWDYSDNRVIVVMVHSHAKIKDIFTHIKAKELHIISIPCCIPHEISGAPYIGVYDQNIWSEKNTIKIWEHVENLYPKVKNNER